MSYLDAGDIALMHDVLIGISNATLIKIENPGQLADNGDSGTPVTAWTGSASAFLLDELREVLSSGVQVKVQATKLRVFDEAGAAVSDLVAGADWQGSTVVVQDDRLPTTVTRRWSVVAMEHESDQTLDSVLLTLNGPSVVA